MSSITDVSERKIRPIYEAIDSANYKSALWHCNKLLKKQPNALILKALKGLILERTGKSDEALQLCAQVKENKPSDEPILQALTLNATRQNPNNEEFGNHLFMAMVRNGDYKGQQQAALKLHKTFGVNKYLFWGIMSLVLQAENASVGQSSIFMTLAERMMLKAVQEDRLKKTEEVHLYLIILLTQNKNKEALEMLEGDLGQICKHDTEINYIRNDLLLKTSNWSKAIEISKLTLTETNSDDWGAYLTYLESRFHLIKSSEKDENGEDLNKTTNLDDARELFHSLQDKGSDSGVVKRGPFLAEFELEKRVISELKDCKPAKEVDILAIEYFRKFGAKACCFDDLQPYLKSVPLEISRKMVEAFKTSIDSTCEDIKSRIQNVYKNINVNKLERYLGLLSDISESDAILYVNKLWRSYNDALQYGVELLDTENQYGDEFVILASHLLIDLYLKKGQNSFILQAIFLLEMASCKSKYNYQFKLLLIRLYQILGVFQRSLELYKSMDIKHVQLDSMSHYICARSSSFAFIGEAIRTCYETLQIYRSNDAETPEMIIQAFKLATFSKVQEFIKFRKELDCSMQRVLLYREIIRLDILSISKDIKLTMEYLERDLDSVIDLSHDDSFCATLCDHRDFTVMTNCNPSDIKSIEEITRVSPILNELENLVNLENKELITLEERHIGEIVSSLGRIYITIKDVRAGQKESIQKLSKIIDGIISILKDFCTEDFTKISLREMSWKHVNQISTFLEACNYIIIVIYIIHEVLLNKNKKSGNKELVQVIQTLKKSVKENLERLNEQLNEFKKKLENEEELYLDLLSFIKSENGFIEFCENELKKWV
ncbi:4025_t:CDS:10 [Funneliformis geosporum]|uniref:8250_t:CDS:1 n=1 Tax=Funneliformis geosporum TaxID=1117311 RepID=A0A9W4WKA1_9GLOM|nr:4025_t:CDS:10 [Funneliformis geosporum]CAI2168213.1 8250_t:CDS:10 [Funneliformis geosporum]